MYKLKHNFQKRRITSFKLHNYPCAQSVCREKAFSGIPQKTPKFKAAETHFPLR